MKSRIKGLLLLIMMMVLLSACAGNKAKVEIREADKLKKMFQDGETFVVYAGRDNCESCKAYRKTVDEVCKNFNFTIYYFPADDFEDAEVKEVVYNYLYKLDWTPTTYLVVDGKSVDLKENPVPYEELVEWLQEYEFIPKYVEQ